MSTTEVYLVIGVPGSGKSWVCEQLKNEFSYVHHDGYIGHINQPEAYVKAIEEEAKKSDKPILAEAPFSITKIQKPLEELGFKIHPVFIIEDPKVLGERYKKREGKPILQQHLTRMKTFGQRAKDGNYFMGTSDQVLAYLKKEAK